MSVIRSKRINGLAGEYNFLADPNQGAVGNVLTGIYIPFYSLLTGFFVIPVVAPTDALGLATISFGHRTEAGVIVPDSLMVATPIAAFTVRNPVQGVDLRANPRSFGNEKITMQVVMVIAGEPLLSGRLAFKIQADSFDI